MDPRWIVGTFMFWIAIVSGFFGGAMWLDSQALAQSNSEPRLLILKTAFGSDSHLVYELIQVNDQCFAFVRHPDQVRVMPVRCHWEQK